MAANVIDELIKEIALKHGVAVGRDDPIFILNTINERLMRDSAASQEAILNSFKSELEAVAHQWGADAKEKAEKILTASLQASREAMHKAMQDGVKAANKDMERSINKNLQSITKPIQDIKKASYLNLMAAGIAFLASCIVLYASIQ